MIGQLLLGQLAAGLQAVFDNRLGQRIDDGTGGGRVHVFHDSPKPGKCIHFCPPNCIIMAFEGAEPWA
jgi:hypothetical protein